MLHKIKIRESFANAVNNGDKTFEVRKNDRGYQKGDTIQFVVLYDSDGCEMISHPLMEKTFEITYVLSGWGIEEGYCVFGIKPTGKDKLFAPDEVVTALVVHGQSDMQFKLGETIKYSPSDVGKILYGDL